MISEMCKLLSIVDETTGSSTLQRDRTGISIKLSRTSRYACNNYRFVTLIRGQERKCTNGR